MWSEFRIMTVQLYKPVRHRSKTLEVSSPPSGFRPKRVSTPERSPSVRIVRHTYKPIEPRLDLILAIEALTHPDIPTFAELEWLASSVD